MQARGGRGVAPLEVIPSACEHRRMTRAVGRNSAVLAGKSELKETQDKAPR